MSTGLAFGRINCDIATFIKDVIEDDNLEISKATMRASNWYWTKSIG